MIGGLNEGVIQHYHHPHRLHLVVDTTKKTTTSTPSRQDPCSPSSLPVVATPVAVTTVIAIRPPLKYVGYSSLDAAALSTSSLRQCGDNDLGGISLDMQNTDSVGSTSSIHPLQMDNEGGAGANGGAISPATSMMLLSIDSRQRPISSMEYAECKKRKPES